MKFFDLIKSRKQKHPEVQALEGQIAVVKNMEDPAEKLLKAEEIRKQSEAILEGINQRKEATAVLLAGGFTIGVVGVAMPWLIPMAIASGLGTGMIGVLFLTDTASTRAVFDVHDQSKEIIKEIKERQDPLSLTASPHFDVIMKNYPALKERFLMASAKEAALQKQAPRLPAPKPPEQGFRL